MSFRYGNLCRSRCCRRLIARSEQVVEYDILVIWPPKDHITQLLQPRLEAVHERVEYYGACGNETVTVDGVTYYPLFNEAYPRPDGAGRSLDLDRYAIVGGVLGMRAASPAAPRVAPPGPGDDIGDMIVYVDGTARFESDSGWVIWLTTDEQTYNWEC